MTVPVPHDELWTVSSLWVHLNGMIEERDRLYTERAHAQDKAHLAALMAQEKALTAALAAAEKAVQKAEAASEKRLDAMNEFRAQLADQAATLMPRSETEIRLTNLDGQIRTLATSVGSTDDKVNNMRSEGKGRDQFVGFLFGAAGFAAAVFAFWRK